jgi:hypothetical protein
MDNHNIHSNVQKKGKARISALLIALVVVCLHPTPEAILAFLGIWAALY